VTDHLDVVDNGQTAIPMDRGGLDTLLSVFHRVCGSLELEQHDTPVAGLIARVIIEAALSGEADADGLYECALRAVLAS
jgi:hypothetical protein